MSVALTGIAGSTEPFYLDVGTHAVAITGQFNGAVAVLERQVPVHDGRRIFDRVADVQPFTKPDAAEFSVGPAAVGSYRLRIDPAGKAPNLALTARQVYNYLEYLADLFARRE